MELLTRHDFATHEIPAGWRIHTRELPGYLFKEAGVLIDGASRLLIPLPECDIPTLRVDLEIVAADESGCMECSNISRSIQLDLSRGRSMPRHCILRGNNDVLRETFCAFEQTAPMRRVSFMFDKNSLRGMIDGQEAITLADTFMEPSFGRLNLDFHQPMLLAKIDIFADLPDELPAPIAPRNKKDFFLEVAVDFNDDLIHAPFDNNMLDRLFGEFKSWGVRRVQWIDTGAKVCPPSYYGPLDIGRNYKKTLEQTGNPQMAAVNAAHAHGIKLVGLVKPFDLGIQRSFGENTPEAAAWGKVMRTGGPVGWINNFVAVHPELLMARKPGNFGAAQSAVITRIDLVKEDDQPCSLRPQDIELWVSNDNAKFQPYTGSASIKEVVEDYPVWEHTASGGRQTGARRPARVFRFNNLTIHNKYVAIAVRSRAGSFTNTLINLLHVFGETGEERMLTFGARARAEPGEKAAGFQTAGVEFERYLGSPTASWPYGDGIRARFTLDAGIGMLAFAKGKDRGVLGALSPAFPESRAFWLAQIGEWLDAGADGVELRLANHQWTFTWGEFGFEAPVAGAFRDRHGVDILATDDFDRAAFRKLRGEHYTEFVRQAGALTRGRGRLFGLHLNPIMNTDPAVGCAMEIHWDWRAWLKEGLADTVTMKYLWPGTRMAREILAFTRPAGVPVTFSPFNSKWVGAGNVRSIGHYIDNARSGGYDGYQLYECAAVVRATPSGEIIMEQPGLKSLFQSVFTA